MDTYECALCKGTFERVPGWTAEHVQAERVARGWGDVAEENLAIVCDDCDKRLQAYLRVKLS